MFAGCCELFVGYCVMSGVCRLSLLFADWRLLVGECVVVWCSLFAVCCVLCVACCLAFVECCCVLIGVWCVPFDVRCVLFFFILYFFV